MDDRELSQRLDKIEAGIEEILDYLQEEEEGEQQVNEKQAEEKEPGLKIKKEREVYEDDD